MALQILIISVHFFINFCSKSNSILVALTDTI
jgi:hypothetical protein